MGMIAQEVEKVFPEATFTNKTDGYKGINYSKLTAVLLEAIKEQKKVIKSQQQTIDEQNNRLRKIEKKVFGGE